MHGSGNYKDPKYKKRWSKTGGGSGYLLIEGSWYLKTVDACFCFESRWMVSGQDIIWSKPNPMPESVRIDANPTNTFFFFKV